MIQYFATTFLVSAGNRSVKSLNVSKFGAPDIIGFISFAAFKLNVSMPILIWISDVIGDVAVIGVELEGVPEGVPGGVTGGVTGVTPEEGGGVAGNPGGRTGLTVSNDGFLANKSFTLVSGVTRPFSIIFFEPGSPAAAALVK